MATSRSVTRLVFVNATPLIVTGIIQWPLLILGRFQAKGLFPPARSGETLDKDSSGHDFLDDTVVSRDVGMRYKSKNT
jgi:hypothetical protein